MQMKYVYKHSDYLFPYEAVNKGESISLCGAGNVCTHYLDQLYTNNYCKVKNIFDSYKKGMSFYGFIIESFESITNDKESRFVLAVESESLANEMKSFLLKKGISNNQIVWKPNKRTCFYCDDNREICKRIRCKREEVDHVFGQGFFRYFCWLNTNLHILTPECGFLRVGSSNDGGYVMGNLLNSSGVAYSYGISNDVSWDDDIADRGYNVYMFDHTIDELPKNRKEFHFFRMGIADSQNHGKELDSLENHLLMNNHEKSKNMILKMDVEGAEYGFADMVRETTLGKFDQIILELHGLNSYDNMNKVIRLINKMNETHVPIHIHANNWGDAILIDDLVFPDVLEVTYLKKGIAKFCDDLDVHLPRLIDAPNCLQLPELELGKWNDCL